VLLRHFRFASWGACPRPVAGEGKLCPLECRVQARGWCLAAGARAQRQIRHACAPRGGPPSPPLPGKAAWCCLRKPAPGAQRRPADAGDAAWRRTAPPHMSNESGSLRRRSDGTDQTLFQLRAGPQEARREEDSGVRRQSSLGHMGGQHRSEGRGTSSPKASSPAWCADAAAALELALLIQPMGGSPRFKTSQVESDPYSACSETTWA
jgi:hypothetical protein